MFKPFVLFVLFALTSNSAYSFKNEPFNELIFESYKELSEQLDESQNLRFHIDIDKSRGINCCNDKMNPKQFIDNRELRKECFKEINGDNDEHYFDLLTCEKLEEIKSQIICLGECLARKLSIVDNSGNIMRDVLIEQIKTNYTDSEIQWKLDASERITDKCLAEIKSDGSSDEEVSSSVASKCNPTALKFAHCMWRESIRECPKDLQVDTPNCIKLREKLENGDNSIKKNIYFRYIIPLS